MSEGRELLSMKNHSLYNEIINFWFNNCVLIRSGLCTCTVISMNQSHTTIISVEYSIIMNTFLCCTVIYPFSNKKVTSLRRISGGGRYLHCA